jgi:hypothetical protein
VGQEEDSEHSGRRLCRLQPAGRVDTVANRRPQLGLRLREEGAETGITKPEVTDEATRVAGKNTRLRSTPQ